ncbi:MAG: hypothetical protein LUD78_00495, partial [Clostridiales bacterium]|nr:hypothetical protein [Clostridiales bacterium]
MSDFIITVCTISCNTSTCFGGGVYIGASNSTYVASFTMTGGTISNNTSGSYGGGVATYTGAITIDITGGTISGNSATGYGGGIYAANRTTVSVANCEVTGNTGTYGGGVYVYTSLTMTGCTVTGNTGTRGGGLYLYTGCPATVSDSSIANNTATAAGDDIYANASSSKPLSLTLSGTPSGTLTACGHDIDGWYSDASGSRWAEDNAVAVDTSETLTNTSALALKAAHGAAEVEFAIVTHPEDVTAEKGSTATFTVVATGTDLTYQWQYQTATGSKWYNCTTTTGEG